jgi:hypothetical protein
MLVGFGILVVPQLAGLVANRVASRWAALSRAIGAIVPFVIVIILWSALADYDDEAAIAAGLNRGAGHTGVMSGFLMLPPVHALVAFLMQAALPYGARNRVQ